MFDLKLFRKDFKLKQEDIAIALGVPQSFISQVETGKDQMPAKWIDIIKEKYSIENIEKYIGQDLPIIKDSKLIPFYDDVISIGGSKDMVAEPGQSYQPAEYVDAGDWFKDATAAIRHYGDSMTEYPSGCILAIKEVLDRSLIIFGKDYVIETSEYRITKRIQSGNKNESITAYSSNKETYPDGRQIHEPFTIKMETIRRLFLVLGYVVKKNGGTMIFNNKIK